jgi:hypothetical protein
MQQTLHRMEQRGRRRCAAAIVTFAAESQLKMGPVRISSRNRFTVLGPRLSDERTFAVAV